MTAEHFFARNVMVPDVPPFWVAGKRSTGVGVGRVCPCDREANVLPWWVYNIGLTDQTHDGRTCASRICAIPMTGERKKLNENVLTSWVP